jgi:TP901 family phage tail tape measure protein
VASASVVAFDILARDRASRVIAKAGGNVSKTTGRMRGYAMRAAGSFAALAGVAGLGAVLKSSVELEASFSKTMNVMQATSGASGRQMKSLSKLAMKMGADTVFSAKDAADAMLELSRGGIKPAQIQAGALKGTLTLAAAGELSMGEAANIAVKSMGQFNLHGKDMGKIAAALAGGANASTASVRDMSTALAQGGLAANSVGFSIQETTGILAAFSNQGLIGSDAGTSLKTMLDRLVPTTKKASTEMQHLGLFSEETGSAFVKRNGEFKSAAQIAGLLNKATKDLSSSERKRAITTIFGADAQRAATVLAKVGAKGVRDMTKATSNQAAAQKMANANMKGTAGALEQFKGSLETAKLQLGLFLAPYVQKGLGLLTKGLNNLVPMVKSVAGAFSGLSGGGGASFFTKIGAVVVPAFQSLAAVVKTDLLPALQNIWPVVKPLGIFLLKMFGSALVGAFKGAVQAIKGLVQVISGVLNFVSDLIHGRWSKLWGDLGQIVRGAGNLIVGVIKALWNGSILGIFRRGALFLTKGIWVKMWTGLKSLAERGWKQLGSLAGRGVAGIGRLMLSGVRGYLRLYLNLFKGLFGIARNGWRVLRSAFGGAMAAIRTVVAHALGAMRGAFVNFFRLQVGLFRNAWTAARGAVANGVGRVVGLVRSLPGKALSALGNLGSVLKNAGVALIQGLIDGIQAKIRDLVGKLGSVTKLIKDHKGPITKDRVLLDPAGRAIMAGLMTGIESQRAALKSTLAGVTADISGTAGAMTATAVAAGAGNAAASRRQSMTDRDIDRMARAFARELERADITAKMDPKHAVDGLKKHKRQHGGKPLGLD